MRLTSHRSQASETYETQLQTAVEPTWICFRDMIYAAGSGNYSDAVMVRSRNMRYDARVFELPFEDTRYSTCGLFLTTAGGGNRLTNETTETVVIGFKQSWFANI